MWNDLRIKLYCRYEQGYNRVHSVVGSCQSLSPNTPSSHTKLPKSFDSVVRRHLHRIMLVFIITNTCNWMSLKCHLISVDTSFLEKAIIANFACIDNYVYLFRITVGLHI